MGKRNKSQKLEELPIKKKKTVISNSNVEEIKDVNLKDPTVSVTSFQTKQKKNKGNKKNQEVNEVLDLHSKLENLEEVNLNEVTVPTTSNHTNPKRRKDKKKYLEVNEKVLDEDAKLDNLVPQLEKVEKKRKIKRKTKHSISNSSGESKKIIFVDDEPQLVPLSKGTTNTEKKKKFLNDEEAEVKDEDIDKFCDELDEEDNKQYDDWVKLIEAKLHENKKSK